jgi:hypothetical protein
MVTSVAAGPTKNYYILHLKPFTFRLYNIMASQIECNTIYRAPQEPQSLAATMKMG